MPESNSNGIPNRKKITRSKGGCELCKIKKRKCDEQRPKCSPCLKRGEDCPGYVRKPLQWSTKYEVAVPPSPLTRDVHQGRPNHDATQRALDEFKAAPIPKAETVYPSVLPTFRPSHSTTSELTIPSRQTSVASFSEPTNQPCCVNSSSSRNCSLCRLRRRLEQVVLPPHLTDVPSLLVSHYFEGVCVIYSTFDTPSNPFRSTIAKIWQGHAPIYFAIQSMAAAYLANDFGHMRPIGMSLQRESLRQLRQLRSLGEQAYERDDRSLLTLIMLGTSASWHSSNDLGLENLEAANELLDKKRARCLENPTSSDSRSLEFFEQCLIYWNMMTAFIGHSAPLSLDPDVVPLQIGSGHGPMQHSKRPALPHPWTGVSARVNVLFTRVVKLVNSHRKNGSWLLVSNLEEFMKVYVLEENVRMFQIALEIEEELLALAPVDPSELVESGDTDTPGDHFISIVEAYQLAGLMLIYRVWPEIYHLRSPLTTEQSEQEDPAEVGPGSVTVESWLGSLALHVVELLQKIPLSSGTRFLQPMVLLVISNELHPSPLQQDQSILDMAFQSNFGLTGHSLKLACGRRFILTRLGELERVLPSPPIARVIELVKETWRRIEGGQESFWLDVMIEKGWETIMG